MSESHPATAMKNITIDPASFDTVSHRENELSEHDDDLFPEEGAQLDANVAYQEDCLEDHEWVLVHAKGQAKEDLEMPVEDGMQPSRHFS